MLLSSQVCLPAEPRGVDLFLYDLTQIRSLEGSLTFLSQSIDTHIFRPGLKGRCFFSLQAYVFRTDAAVLFSNAFWTDAAARFCHAFPTIVAVLICYAYCTDAAVLLC